MVEESNYGYYDKKSFNSASKVKAGLFARYINHLSKSGKFYTVFDREPKKRESLNQIGELSDERSDFDLLSLSSINTPGTKIVKKDNPQIEKCEIELMFNPFGLITDAVRSTHSFFYSMPIVKLSDERLRMFHRSKLPLVHGKYEFFGIPAVTLFLDKDSKESEYILDELTGVPLSLAGDGFVVNENFVKDITLLYYEDDNLETKKKPLEMPLEYPFKLQGVARSKGMTIGKIKSEYSDKLVAKFEIAGKEYELKIDIIMNTQKKRLNKVANIVASQIRLRRYFGEEIEPIDQYDKETLKKIVENWKDNIVTANIYLGEDYLGQALVGINKYYLDLQQNFEPEIKLSAVRYSQIEALRSVIPTPFPVYLNPKKEKYLKEFAKMALDLVELLNKVKTLEFKTCPTFDKEASEKWYNEMLEKY